MGRDLKTRYRVDLIAAELESARRKSGSFDAFQYERFVPILISALISKKVPSQIAREEIVHAALNRASGNPPITESSLELAITKATQDYRRKRQQSYIVATSLSVPLPSRVIRLGKTTITLGGKPPARLIRARNAALQTSYGKPPQAPLRSTFTRVALKARTPGEAVELALGHLDFVRGLWFLVYSHGFQRISKGGYPLAPIIVGPVHTLHDERGDLAQDSVWTRSDYPRSIGTRLGHFAGGLSLWKQEKELRDSLLKVPYRDRVVHGIKRYARALDEKDLETAAVRLWSILELLCATRQHEKVVKRASALYDNPDLKSAVLEHLRESRRLIVHDDESWTIRYSEPLAGELSATVHDLLVFHITNGRDFQSLEQAAQFFDLPPDRRILEKALRFYCGVNE